MPAGKLVAHEVVALRDAHSTTTAGVDGSLVTRVSRQSVHWFDREQAVWRDVDSGLSASAKAGVGWRSGSNRFTVELADRSGGDALAWFEARQGRMAIALEDAVAGKAAAKAGKSAVTFRGVRPGVDLQYAVLPDGLKESIVLRDAAAPSKLSFRLTPDKGAQWRAERLDSSEMWMFFAGGDPEPAFVLLPPSVGDSRGVPAADGATSDGVPQLVNPASGMASLEVEREGDGSFVATVSVDEKWLHDSERVFPVVVDPTVYSQPDTADGYYDTVNGGNPSFGSTLMTGAYGVGQPPWMSVLSFDVGSIPPGATVLDAKLSAWLDNCFPGHCDAGNAGSIRLRRLTGGWSASTPWSTVSSHIDAATLAQVVFPSGTTRPRPGRPGRAGTSPTSSSSS